MIDSDPLIAKLADANPVASGGPRGREERAEAQRVLGRVLRSPPVEPRAVDASIGRTAGRVAGWLALGAGAAAVVVVVVALAAAGGRGPLPVTAQSALEKAARAAAAGSTAPALRAGQVWDVQAVEVRSSQGFQTVPTPRPGQRPAANAREVPLHEVLISRSPIEKAITADGQLFESDTLFGNPRAHHYTNGFSEDAAGFGDWDPNHATSLPTNPAALLRVLHAEQRGYWGYTKGKLEQRDTDTSAFTTLAEIAALLGEEPLRPDARAAVFKTAAELPGLRYLGDVPDPLGRSGIAVAEETTTLRPFDYAGPQAYLFELIFNPATGAVLGSRTVALDPLPVKNIKAATVVFSWTYARSRVISAADVPAPLKQMITQTDTRRTAMRRLRQPGGPCHRAPSTIGRARPSSTCQRAMLRVLQNFGPGRSTPRSSAHTP